MISLGDKNCIPFRGDKRPLAVYSGDKTVFEPITTTVSGTSVTVENTYNDQIDSLVIYGACEQDTSTDPESPSPDYPSEIRCVGGTLTVSNLGGTKQTTMDVPDLYAVGDVQDVLHVDHGQKMVWVERNCAYLALTSDAVIGLYSSGGNGVFFYNVLPVSLSRPMYVSNRSSYSALIYNSDLFWVGVNNTTVYWIGVLDTLNITTTSEFRDWLDENPTYIIYQLATPTIEELDYATLPTHYGGTVVNYTANEDGVVPDVTTTLKKWKE